MIHDVAPIGTNPDFTGVEKAICGAIDSLESLDDAHELLAWLELQIQRLENGDRSLSNGIK